MYLFWIASLNVIEVHYFTSLINSPLDYHKMYSPNPRREIAMLLLLTSS